MVVYCYRVNRWLRVLDWVAGAAVAGLALAVYSATRSAGAYPGESARELARCAGLIPSFSPESPLWHWVAGAIGAAAGRGAVDAINWFSVLCGALAAWLMYRATSVGLRLAISPGETGENRSRAAAVFGGAVAAMFLAFCMPFWISSTRATPDTFHTAMLLGAVAAFFRWWENGGIWRLVLCWIVCGLGVVEFTTFILFAPLLAGATLFRLWDTQALTPSRVLAFALAGAVPLLLYPVAAAAFTGTEGCGLLGQESMGQVLWSWWRDQYFFLRYGLPQVGWLLVLCLTVVPWLTMLLVARHALNRASDAWLIVLHVVMGGVVAVLLLNLTISPWKLVGWGSMLVTPYAMAASVYGYLAAYAFLLPQGWWSRDPAVGSALRRRRDIVGSVLAAPFLAAMCVAPFLNLAEADGRPAGFVNRMAAEIVAAAGGRQWLVTDGVMDNHILLAAHGAGSGLRTVNLADRTDAYRRQLAARFEQPAYRNLIQVGTANFVREWLAGDPGATGKVAVLSEPDLWLAAGFTPVPSRMVYVGSAAGPAGDVDALVAGHRSFWEGIPPASTNGMRQPADWLAAHLRRHAGAVANNTGVYLEDVGRTNEAYSAYQAARRIDASNLSALLNLGVMLDRGFKTAEAAAVKSDLDALKKTVRQKMRVWTLSRHYGYVRLPELYVQEGLGWVLSGQPGLGVPRLLKAVALAGDPARVEAAQQALAYAYLAQNEPEAGEAVYRSILERDSSNVAALLGMSRIEARNRRFQPASSYLERAEKAGVPARAVALDWASLYLAAGEAARARAILERMVDEDPSIVKAWAMLAGISAHDKDAHGVDRCLQRLDTMREGQGVAALIRAKLAMDRVDLNAARRHLDAAHKAMPAHAGALELLLKVDMLQAKQDMARTHALALLRIRPNNALANYALGAVHLAQGRFDLAEDLLRRSMAEERTPAVLNDLGWLLCRQERYADAEKMTRESLAMRPDMYQGWDTLAVILMKTGRLDEADEALRKAIGLFPDDPAVHLHKAELLLLRGNREAARQVVDGIRDRRDLLPMEDRMRFEDLIRSLKAGGR